MTSFYGESRSSGSGGSSLYGGSGGGSTWTWTSWRPNSGTSCEWTGHSGGWSWRSGAQSSNQEPATVSADAGPQQPHWSSTSAQSSQSIYSTVKNDEWTSWYSGKNGTAVYAPRSSSLEPASQVMANGHAAAGTAGQAASPSPSEPRIHSSPASRTEVSPAPAEPQMRSSPTPRTEVSLSPSEPRIYASQTPRTDAKRAAKPPPRPDDVAEVLRALASNRAAARTGQTSLDVQLFERAIQICFASRESCNVDTALELFDEMKDDLDLKPSAATYFAVLDACEGTQPLERVWMYLKGMREQGLDPFAQVPEEEGSWTSPPDNILQGLERHAEAWLRSKRLPQTTFQASLRLATLLRRHNRIGAAPQDNLRRQVLRPIVEALQEPLMPDSPRASALKACTSLGAFTDEVLAELGMAASKPERWLPRAKADLKRQALLRRWVAWEEAAGPGVLAWIAFDVSGGEGQDAWSLCSDGEAFGFVVGEQNDEVAAALLPPMVRNESAGHAERRALLSLTERIFERFPAHCAEGMRIDGVVMLYSPETPSVSSLYAMRQFLKLFPWIQIHCSHGGGEGIMETSGRDVEVIGAVAKRPDLAEERRRFREQWLNDHPDKGKGKGKDIAIGGANSEARNSEKMDAAFSSTPKSSASANGGSQLGVQADGLGPPVNGWAPTNGKSTNGWAAAEGAHQPDAGFVFKPAQASGATGNGWAPTNGKSTNGWAAAEGAHQPAAGFVFKPAQASGATGNVHWFAPAANTSSAPASAWNSQWA